MRDHTQGNTMAKVWRQVQESHCEEYLHRKDLYTTLLSQLNKPGGITSKSDLTCLFVSMYRNMNSLSDVVNRSFPSAGLNNET